MTNHMRIGRIGLICLILLLIAGMGAALMRSYRQEAFAGSCVKATDGYFMDIERMSGRDRHTLALQKGDALHIRFITEQGSVHLAIKAPDGTAIYQGNGRETTDFTVNISEGGVYGFEVKANRGKGVIQIQRTGEKQ